MCTIVCQYCQLISTALQYRTEISHCVIIMIELTSGHIWVCPCPLLVLEDKNGLIYHVLHCSLRKHCIHGQFVKIHYKQLPTCSALQYMQCYLYYSSYMQCTIQYLYYSSYGTYVCIHVVHYTSQGTCTLHRIQSYHVVCLPVGTYIYSYYMIYVACFTRHSLILSKHACLLACCCASS